MASEISEYRRGIKRDQCACEAWGELYERIPKSVFAVVAWHFANRIAEGSAIDAVTEFFQEWQVLHDGGHIPQKPVKR